MVKVTLNGMMEEIIKVILKMVLLKVKENLFGQEEKNILVIINLIKKMELELIIGMIIFIMKVIGLIINNMVMGFFVKIIIKLKVFLDLGN